MAKLKDDLFVINKAGKEIEAYSSKEFSELLIEKANNFKASKIDTRVSVSQDDYISFYSHRILSDYLKRKSSLSFLEEINKEMCQMTFQFLLYKKPNSDELMRKFVWYQKDSPDVEELISFAFSAALSTGRLNHLKKCNFDKCEKFFYGKSNQQWCSQRCGSKYRMQKKRFKDKNKGSMF